MNHTAPIPPSIRPMNPMLKCMQLPELTAFSIVLMILITELVDLIRSRGHYRRSPKKRPVQSRVRHCSGASIIITAGSSMRLFILYKIRSSFYNEQSCCTFNEEQRRVFDICSFDVLTRRRFQSCIQGSCRTQKSTLIHESCLKKISLPRFLQTELRRSAEHILKQPPNLQ